MSVQEYLFHLLIVAGVVIQGLAGNQTSDDLQPAIELFEQRRFSEAAPLLVKVISTSPDHAMAHYYMGRNLLELLDHDQGIEHLRKAASLEERPEFYHWLGRAYAQKAMQSSILAMPAVAKRSIRATEKAIALDPDNLDARYDRVQYYLNVPWLLGGSAPKALQEAEAILARDPRRGHFALARVREHKEEWNAAEEEYKAVLDLDSTDNEALYELGRLYEKQDRFVDALKTFEKLLALAPRNVNACYRVGRIGALSGLELDWAEACLKSYIERPASGGPSAADALWRLGMVYERKQQPKLARQQYQRALHIDSGHKEAKRALKKLK